MNNKITLPIAILIAAGTLTAGAISADAYFGGGNQDDFATKIANRLGVDKGKLTAVLEEMHDERHSQMEERFETKLNEAVSNGSITSAQKTTIEVKHEELEKKHEANRESFQAMTPEEKRSTRQSERDELEAWANTQGINLSDFFVHGNMGEQGRIRGPMMK